MANLPYWDDDSEDAQEWDAIQLGPFPRLPGVWDVEDGNVKRVVDIKKAPGRDGATIKDEGYENGRFRLVGQLFEREDWWLLQSVLDEIHPKKRGKASEPYSIYHPKLSALQVHNVRVVEIGLPRIDNGLMTIVIEVVEWIKEPKKAKKPQEAPISDLQRQQAAALGVQAPDGLAYAPSATPIVAWAP